MKKRIYEEGMVNWVLKREKANLFSGGRKKIMVIKQLRLKRRRMMLKIGRFFLVIGCL